MVDIDSNGGASFEYVDDISTHAKNRILSGIITYLVESDSLEEAIQISEKIDLETQEIADLSQRQSIYFYKSLALIEIGNKFNSIGQPQKAQRFFYKSSKLARTIDSLSLRDDIAIAFARSGQIDTAFALVKRFLINPKNTDIPNKDDQRASYLQSI